MSRLKADLVALRHNIEVVNGWMEGHGARWTLVTKVLCGHTELLKALLGIGVQSIGDSRLENLYGLGTDQIDELETWYLRLPHLAAIPQLVRHTSVSLNSEREIIEALNEEAGQRGMRHKIIIMVELGDLREGVLPGKLLEFYQRAFKLDHIDVIGVGANIGCLSGAVPNIEQLNQLVLYRELLELKYGYNLPLISAGSSVMLPLLLNGQIPRAVNHFRIGEAVFLGKDLINGGTLPGLRNDAFILEGEVVEIKEKSLTPSVETSAEIGPFETFDVSDHLTPGQRGYRALITLGQLDTDVAGLTPVNSDYYISGASSDLAVVNIGEDPGGLQLGDTIEFRLSYTALLRAMNSRYISKVITPGLQEFDRKPALDELQETNQMEDLTE